VYRCTFKHFDNSKGAFAAITFDKCLNLRVHECTFSDIGMAKSPIGHNVCIMGGIGFARRRPFHAVRDKHRDRRGYRTGRLHHEGPLRQ
jgi:hypothetical protein